ncbi:MAG: hypothetical protein V9G63_09820 [Candidatus Competibacter sp.]|jgi:hypothetical protein
MNRNQARQAGRKLLGDRIVALAETAGVARAARQIERLTGWDCGCARRTAALNRWDAGRRS